MMIDACYESGTDPGFGRRGVHHGGRYMEQGVSLLHVLGLKF